MKNIALLVVLSMFLISSCKKGKAEFTLTGTITDSTFGTGLSGANVKLYSTEAGSLTTSAIASSTLDADGKFSFTFPRDKVETYYLEVQKANYFTIYESIPFQDLSIKDENVRNYATTAKAWVKVHITNTGGQANDVIEYIRDQGKVNCEECCPGGYRYYYGAVDTTYYCVNDGNSEFSGTYWVQGGGPTGQVWIISTAFDTVNVNIAI